MLKPEGHVLRTHAVPYNNTNVYNTDNDNTDNVITDDSNTTKYNNDSTNNMYNACNVPQTSQLRRLRCPFDVHDASNNMLFKQDITYNKLNKYINHRKTENGSSKESTEQLGPEENVSCRV